MWNRYYKVSYKPDHPPPFSKPELLVSASLTTECSNIVSSKPALFRTFTKPELPPPLFNDCKVIVTNELEKSAAQPELLKEAKICGEICSKCKKRLENSDRTNDGAQQKVDSSGATWRRQCGCLKTSEKLKELLKRFPAPPPPPPPPSPPSSPLNKQLDPNFCKAEACVSSCYAPVLVAAPSAQVATRSLPTKSVELVERQSVYIVQKPVETKPWRLLSELVEILQLSMTATALALYYIIYIYMQMVYFTLRSALYFHNADGPMRITIGVVTLTSLIVLFNVVLRMEKLVGYGY